MCEQYDMLLKIRNVEPQDQEMSLKLFSVYIYNSNSHRHDTNTRHFNTVTHSFTHPVSPRMRSHVPANDLKVNCVRKASTEVSTLFPLCLVCFRRHRPGVYQGPVTRVAKFERLPSGAAAPWRSV